MSATEHPLGSLSKKLVGPPPDILDCIASLSNDEVPTPPWLANRMLDVLPATVWEDQSLRWLDPFTKSGVFLREVARRLLWGVAADDDKGRTPTPGLTRVFPDEDSRRRHIFMEMIWGLAITELTGDQARRSVYYTVDASSEWSVVRFPTNLPQGRIPFVRSHHDFGPNNTKACAQCGAPPALERGDARENHAYSFLHHGHLPQEFPMKFDIIVGNPPYQLETGGHGSQARPIYHLFVERSIDLAPRYVLMITPSRWFSGGMGLDKFRARMLGDRRIRLLVDYPALFEVFPDAEIKGGVSYFLWDRDRPGDCRVTTIRGGRMSETVSRRLDTYDVFVRDNAAVSILEKVRAADEGDLSEVVSSLTPFGLGTKFKGAPKRRRSGDILVHGNKAQTWAKREDVRVNVAWVDRHKVLVPKAGDGHGRTPASVIGAPIVAGPGTACTMTYLVAGNFATAAEAENYAAFLRTKFVRFLVSLRKTTQDTTRGKFAFVPALPMTQQWTDEELYERYGLSPEERALIEAEIKEMPVAAAKRATKGRKGGGE